MMDDDDYEDDAVSQQLQKCHQIHFKYVMLTSISIGRFQFIWFSFFFLLLAFGYLIASKYNRIKH